MFKFDDRHSYEWNKKQEEAKKELLEEENQESDLDAVEKVMKNPVDGSESKLGLPELAETLKELSGENLDAIEETIQKEYPPKAKTPPRNAR